MSSNLKAANAAKMKRMMSRKSHSWWWDSHISPKNSKWLADNLEKMDRCVKEMLKLIEEDGDSFARKAEMYYQRRPELVSHVEDFYRMYRGLAERYDHVTGELRKNLQSELNSQDSWSGSELGSEPPSPSQPSFDQTPEPKPAVPKAAGFKVFLGSDGTSDRSRKGSDASSSSSDSDSDSDDIKDLDGDNDGISSDLHQRIFELENELDTVKEKLKEHENCGVLANGHADLSSKVSALEDDLLAANEKLRISEAEMLSLRQKLDEENFSSEVMSTKLSHDNVVISGLETQIVQLESELAENKREIDDLKVVVSVCNQEIEQYKAQIADVSENFLQEKSHLEAEIVKLEGVIKELKEEIGRISEEKSKLEGSTLKQQHVIEELKAILEVFDDKFSLEKSLLKTEISSLSQSVTLLEGKIMQLEAEKASECAKRDECIVELNISLESLKQKVAMLLLEKDQLSNQVNVLNDDIRCRDERVRQMDEHLHKLHMDHVNLMNEIKEARRQGGELREWVKELEEEVERQRIALSDGAEGKREAIRQLCFSLEHYRDGYHHLRQLLQGHYKRPPTVMVV